MLKRGFTILLLVCVCPLATGSAQSATSSAMAGWWVGSYNLAGPGSLTFELGTRRAFVALGVGHAGGQAVRISIARSRVRFKLPGRPKPLVFDGRYRGGRINGTVRQGKLRGLFRVRRGEARSLIAPGFYSVGDRLLGVVDDPYGPARLVDLDSGAVNALYPSGDAFTIG